MPSRTAVATCFGSDASSSSATCASRIDLGPRPLERRVEPRAGDALRACLRDPLPCPFECLFVHGRKATLAVG